MLSFCMYLLVFAFEALGRGSEHHLCMGKHLERSGWTMSSAQGPRHP